MASQIKLKLKTNLYSAVKSEDSEALSPKIQTRSNKTSGPQ